MKSDLSTMQRPIHPFWAIVLLLPSLVSTLVLFAGLGILLWLSLHHTPNSHAAGFTTFLELEYLGLDNYIALARTYLQRQAILNTGLVTIITCLLALPSAILLANLLGNLLTQGWRTALIVLALVPVVMPTVLGTLAWRKLFDLLYPIYNSEYTILALAVIQTWRVLPIMSVILLFSGTTREQSFPQHFTRFSYPAIGLSLLISIFLIITDVSVGLIFTEGESINHTTPLWGTWAFQLGYTTGDFGQSAASLISFIPLLVLLVLPLSMLANRIQWCYPVALQEHETIWQRLGVICFGLFFTIPLITLFFQPASMGINSDLLSQLYYFFVKSDYGQWLMNTTLVWCGAALVAILAGVPAGYSLARQWSPLANLLLWISLIAGPVAFVPLAWSSQHWTWVDSRWVLAWLYGACTAPLTACLTMHIVKQVSDVMQGQPLAQRVLIWTDTKFSTYLLLIISFVLPVQPFATALVLQQQTLSVGIVAQLAYNTTFSPIVLALAICLPTLLGILVCGLVLRSFLRAKSAIPSSL